jgi:acetyltransferase-like isoleucine patch superfamily enzyme
VACLTYGEQEIHDIFPQISFGHSVQLIGVKNINIDNGTVISDNVWLNVCIRDEKIRMKIGKCVLIGRQSVVSTAGYLEIGDYCLFGPRVYVSDADHVFCDISKPIVQQGVTLGRTVILEENCWVGVNAVINGNLTIGRGSVIAASAIVLKDVPPFSVVVGNPGRIVKMYNPQTKLWEKIRDDENVNTILKIRKECPIPSREEYKDILCNNAGFKKVDPIAGGRGISI